MYQWLPLADNIHCDQTTLTKKTMDYDYEKMMIGEGYRIPPQKEENSGSGCDFYRNLLRWDGCAYN